MNKQEIESTVRTLLENESPLDTAIKYEIEAYNYYQAEVKRSHIRNLEQILKVFQEIGAADSGGAQKIKERLKQLKDGTCPFEIKETV